MAFPMDTKFLWFVVSMVLAMVARIWSMISIFPVLVYMLLPLVSMIYPAVCISILSCGLV